MASYGIFYHKRSFYFVLLSFFNLFFNIHPSSLVPKE